VARLRYGTWGWGEMGGGGGAGGAGGGGGGGGAVVLQVNSPCTNEEGVL